MSWSLTAAMPGAPLADLCVEPAPAGLRDLATEAAALLRTLHSWPLPEQLAGLLSRSEADPLRLAGAQLVLPPLLALGLTPLAEQLPFVDHGVLHGDFCPDSVLVHDGHISALIDFEFARRRPSDMELLSATLPSGRQIVPRPTART